MVLLIKNQLSEEEVNVLLRYDPNGSYKCDFPKDVSSKVFPISICTKKQLNGEMIEREWLLWNDKATGLQCMLCHLFSNLPSSPKSSWAKPEGITRWRKLHDREGAHENSNNHKSCHITWKKGYVTLRTSVVQLKVLLQCSC